MQNSPKMWKHPVDTNLDTGQIAHLLSELYSGVSTLSKAHLSHGSCGAQCFFQLLAPLNLIELKHEIMSVFHHVLYHKSGFWAASG